MLSNNKCPCPKRMCVDDFTANGSLNYLFEFFAEKKEIKP